MAILRGGIDPLLQVRGKSSSLFDYYGEFLNVKQHPACLIVLSHTDKHENQVVLLAVLKRDILSRVGFREHPQENLIGQKA